MNPIDRLVSEHEYAASRGVSVRTPQRERALRIGPPYVKIGRKVYYRPEAIEAWVAAQERSAPGPQTKR